MATTAQEPSWEELIGSNDWESLLDPLNLSLRKLLLRCGDFCQATYDSFVNDQNSKYCGTSRYGKSTLFEKVMLDSASDYVITNFLYATARVSVPESLLLHSHSRESWDRESNWIGYIAVTSDERSKALGRREIYVVWRGTTRDYEWVNVFKGKPESAECLLNDKFGDSEQNKQGKSSNDESQQTPNVMFGWLTLYTSDDPKSPFTKLSARKQLLGKIMKLREQYKDENPTIVFTGHSLGASLAVLSAFDTVENCVHDIPVTAFVFGCPQVGDKAFNERLKRHLNLKILHTKNTIDVIPRYPGELLGYVNTGTELIIDTRKSPSLKDSKNNGDWHNLQAMLHIVAGWNGKDGEFELKVKRSLALVNKSCAFLKDELLVPGSWWVEKNKGLIKTEDGEWIMAPSDEDLLVPEI
ncbi:PREDICTED: phospholipase A1-IIdelta [Theobroma cacao]|uniref:Phospholipase A1 n=1 Tax=Theobroma cacao TaxID=3641 RepID=A0AB32VPB0_THECC|nr:PREDICTED: phospholipase A1-IIdelta [Theobroma cacao]